MAEVILSELYPSPWGIVESRRSEIEAGSHGIFERVLNEEINNMFYPIARVAQIMGCHPSTARRWLHDFDGDPRYIIRGGARSCTTKMTRWRSLIIARASRNQKRKRRSHEFKHKKSNTRHA